MFSRRGSVSILLSGLLVLAGGACGDTTGGDDARIQLAIQPQLPASFPHGVFDLAVDAFASA